MPSLALAAEDETLTTIEFKPVHGESAHGEYFVACVDDLASCERKCETLYGHDANLKETCQMAVTRHFLGRSSLTCFEASSCYVEVLRERHRKYSDEPETNSDTELVLHSGERTRPKSSAVGLVKRHKGCFPYHLPNATTEREVQSTACRGCCTTSTTSRSAYCTRSSSSCSPSACCRAVVDNFTECGNVVDLVRLRDLRVGQKVRVGDDRFEPILGFLHKDESVSSVFCDVSYNCIEDASTGGSIRLTPDHMVFVSSSPCEKSAKMAQSLTPRVDRLLVCRANCSTQEAEIVSVTPVQSRGICAPLTESGRIVVNGVLSSCYAHAMLGHESCHAVLAPLRWMLRARLEWFTRQENERAKTAAAAFLVLTSLPGGHHDIVVKNLPPIGS
ncbi:unnamed protein product [Amoebophrya sp. A25]|nr:unnamed protein product [Amoebophrya sp. A25]|eukprot:GSA25T00013188001.1